MTIQEHVAQDSRTAHQELMDDLCILNLQVTDLYYADNNVTRDMALMTVERLIVELIQKHQKHQ